MILLKNLKENLVVHNIIFNDKTKLIFTIMDVVELIKSNDKYKDLFSIYTYIFSNEFYFTGEQNQKKILNKFGSLFRLNKDNIVLKDKEIYSTLLDCLINSDYDYDQIKLIIKEGKSMNL